MEIDLDSILLTFSAETEERLSEMEEALIALEAYPEDEKPLEAIFRGAHTIKGNAASLGFPKVTGFAHVFEELLQRFRNHTMPVTPKRITLLLRSVDALRQMVPEAIAGADELQPAHVALLHELASGNPSGASEEPVTVSAGTIHRSKSFGRRQEDFQAWMERAGTVRVDIQKLDRMLNLAGEITVAHGRLREVLETRSQGGKEALEAQGQVERLSLDLQEQIMKVRMLPIGPIFRQYIRTVRDVAQANGKIARLAMGGEDVEIDLSVVEHLKDPLTHMIRNALDHGIETPEIRQAQGKDRCGLITLSASHDGANILIQAKDDGAGLSRERIVKRARSLGMIAEPEKLADQDLYQLIFEPGFSTAETITDISGRGVGMDVVRRNIEILRGSLAIDSQPGRGTTITIRLPLTLAIIDGFGVGVGDETYVIPMHTVLECLKRPTEEQHQGNRFGVINLRGEPLPYVCLRDWFDLPGPRPKRENIIVVEVDRVKAGLAVDTLLGARQTVIKPLGEKFKDVRGIAGSAILGNGRVALIVDVQGLLRDVIRSQGDAAARPVEHCRADAIRTADNNIPQCLQMGDT
jgi:two-component system chemotaxis sensor kinase CheA